MQRRDDATAATAVNVSGAARLTGGCIDPPMQGELREFAACVKTQRVRLAR